MTVINTNTGSLYAQQAMTTNARGLSTVMQQLSTGKRINNAVDDVAGMAISTRLTSQIRGLNLARAKMGAVISRLQFTADNLANVSAKAQESRSRIEDTDYSQATTELAKRNIIQQAAQAMLAQANQQPQTVLQLLR